MKTNPIHIQRQNSRLSKVQTSQWLKRTRQLPDGPIHLPVSLNLEPDEIVCLSQAAAKRKFSIDEIVGEAVQAALVDLRNGD